MVVEEAETAFRSFPPEVCRHRSATITDSEKKSHKNNNISQVMSKRARYVKESRVCQKEPGMSKRDRYVKESQVCQREPGMLKRARYVKESQYVKESHVCQREPGM
jgi:hypothetical protein